MTTKDLDTMSDTARREMQKPQPSPQTWTTTKDGAFVGTTGGTPQPVTPGSVTKI